MTPKSVRVLNYDYKIVVKPKMAEELGHDGLCDATNKVIFLDKGLSPKERLRVLMHELMHAVQFESGLCEVLDHQAQELLSETMAGFLTSALHLKFTRK